MFSPCSSPSQELDDVPLPFTEDRSDTEEYEGVWTPPVEFVPVLAVRDIIPRISSSVLVDLLTGVYDEFFCDLYIVDCRFDYEYAGGCIQGAFNITDPEDLIKGFFEKPLPNSIIVFHCEYSHNRGPDMGKLFREIDRRINLSAYPRLYYPHVYILDGGYRQFYREWPSYCVGGYVTMLDNKHRLNGDLVRCKSQLEKNMEKIRAEHRKALVEVNRKPKADPFRKSPIGRSPIGSPVTARRLDLFASP